MASRILASRAIASSRVASPSTQATIRSFQTTRTLRDAVPVAPVKKPVGAFRGGLFGFLLGTSLAGASVYYYILEEYRVSNQILSEDIYSLQATVQRTHAHINELENRLAQQNLKK